jgi:hypothetical protein
MMIFIVGIVGVDDIEGISDVLIKGHQDGGYFLNIGQNFG